MTTRDQLGQPVAAELSLALVDEALFRPLRDSQSPIGSFFYDQERTGAFATGTSDTFRYEPASVPVPEAVAEEGARQATFQLGVVRLDTSRFEVGAGSIPSMAAAAIDTESVNAARRLRAHAAPGS